VVDAGSAAATSAVEESIDTAALDDAVASVAARVDDWVSVPPRDRSELLALVVRDTLAASGPWNDDACGAKGLAPDSLEGAEELFSGVGTLIRMAQTLRRSLADIAAGRAPQYPGPVRHRAGGRISVGVLPSSRYDRLLFSGISAEVWMQPGVSERDVREEQAAAYRDPVAARGVTLVLGAGNVASLGPRDALNELFVNGRVVVLKANPVNEYLVPHWERALGSLINEGVLTIVTGAAGAGEHLAQHPLVGSIHVTGSDKTHDAIVFGPGAGGATNKAAGRRRNEKAITSELGNVSPVVIVPGEWSRAEIEYQAAHVATMFVNNAGFNCLTPRVLVTWERWAQRAEFLDALEDVLAALPTRRAYYPGARERHGEFVAAHPDARQIGDVSGGRLPWTLVRGVDPSSSEEICFRSEAFCSLCAETALDAVSPAEFVARATGFCNDALWGTLSMTLLAHPRELADAELGPSIERAVAELRYGTIGVNVWHALGFALGTTTWGAFPGHDDTDIQSGRGVVANAFMFARPEKSVVRGPFVARPRPAYFATSARGAPALRRLVDFEAAPRLVKVPGLALAALRS
jgi:hypothetical protein